MSNENEECERAHGLLEAATDAFAGHPTAVTMIFLIRGLSVERVARAQVYCLFSFWYGRTLAERSWHGLAERDWLAQCERFDDLFELAWSSR